ncbi:MAG TPA: DUF4129 domain-containing protein [Gemmatimonadaceae bacterium]
MTLPGTLAAMGQGPDSAHWTARAIQDTVAAITRQPAYQRALSSTWMGRLLSWFWDAVARLLKPLGTLDLSHLILGLAFVLAILVVAHFVLAARADATEWSARQRRGAGRRTRDYWADAQAFAATGDFMSASHALYAALLVRLAGRGAVRLHPSKTAGDYARDLRRRGAPEERPFQAFRRRYDRLVYGTGVCSAQDFAALMADAGVLLERAA